MAGPEKDAGETPRKICFLHCDPSAKGVVTPFSEHSWARFLEFVDKWKVLRGTQSEIARKFESKNDEHDEREHEGQSGPPNNAGYHRSCYARFTDKYKLQRARAAEERRQQKFPETASTSHAVADHDSSSDEDSPPKKQPRLLRSSAGLTSEQQRSKHVLPPICIICRKKKWTSRRTSTGTRRLERLINCSTIEAESLKQAARDRNDSGMLLHIERSDCVAIEVRYHFSCYRDYTRYLTKRHTETIDNSNSEAYGQFCATVKERVIGKREILRLTRLNEIFIQQVKATDGIDISSYKTTDLKKRLKSTFPQLCFLRPHDRRQSDIVYVSDLPVEALVQDRQVLHEALHVQSSSTTESERETTDAESDVTDQKKTPASGSKTCNPTRDLFMSAQALKREISDITVKLPWPPTASQLTPDAAEQFVPVALYNFLAWTVGACDELPENGMYASVEGHIHNRTLNIAQDVIYLASRGRIQTPKQLALAMTVRHLSGSAQLIGLLNGLGYSVSHSVALEHDTAIAEQEMNRGGNALPAGIKEGHQAVLVWDNNDFGEETLSGRGTTHNTNGIIIQHPAAPSSPPSSQQSEAAPTSKKTHQRTIKPPETNIIAYLGSQKEGQKPFAKDVPVRDSAFKAIQEHPRQLDLAYNLTRFSIDEAVKVPAWTGFNQLSSEVHVPPKSVVGYLPILDASPTEMSTVLTLLHRSVQIANQLKLNALVVVLDQALYSKAQIIRWRNAVFMKRLVIRLGAFHTSMAYMGCIGKRFKDAGLQDILIEAEVVAAGSIGGVISGHHYNRPQP